MQRFNFLSSLKKPVEKLFTPKDETLFPAIQKTILNHDSKEFEAAFSKATLNPHFDMNAKDKDGNSLLHYCIQNSNAIQFNELVKKGADVTVTSNGETLLYSTVKSIVKAYADKSGFSASGPLIKILVEILNHPKTNLKERRGRSSLLRSITGIVRLQDLVGLSPENAQRFRLLKDIVIAGHRYGLEGRVRFDGFKVNLEGFGLGPAAEEVINTYQAFLTNEDIRKDLNVMYNTIHKTENVDYFDPRRNEVDVATLIQADLSCIGQPLKMTEFLERDRNKEITPVYICCSVNDPADHAIAYLFYDDFCVRINCGGSTNPDEVSGIKFYHIGNKKEFLKEMPKLLDSIRYAVDDSYLQKDFIEKCHLKLVYTVKRPDQRVGNCTFRSLEELQLALLIMHFYRYFANNSAKSWSLFSSSSVSKNLDFAKEAGEIVFNLLMHFDRDLGAIKFKQIEHRFSETDRAKIKRRCMEKGATDRIKKREKGLPGFYDGIKPRALPPSPPDFKEVERDNKEDMSTDATSLLKELEFDLEAESSFLQNESLYAYYHSQSIFPAKNLESKRGIERIILTADQMLIFAKEKGHVDEKDLQTLLELLKSNSDDAKNNPIYLKFIAELSGIDFIIYIPEENTFSIGFTSSKPAAETKEWIKGLDNLKLQMH